MMTYASNEPMEGDEWQIARGIGHVNEQMNVLAQQVFMAATEAGAVSTLLHERGLITTEELKAQREVVAKRLQAAFQEKKIGVRIDNRVPDKYVLPPESLPQIDCEARIPLCRGACCALRFPVSAQDLDEGVVRWDLGEPYINRVGPDTRCVHQHRETFGCTIYARRPAVCRVYDCRKDGRIWLDFENRVINPKLFVQRSDGALIPNFEEPATQAGDGGAGAAEG